MKLFSYVVHHDTGFAPNPNDRFCTLVYCKFKGGRNVVDLVQEGDWIVGTGGKNPKLSCGRNDRIIYVMHVDEKLPFAKFLRDPRFRGRSDCKDLKEGNSHALISSTFFYFGKNAVPVGDIPAMLRRRLGHPIEKKGPGFRSDFPEAFVRGFADWVQGTYEVGKHGEPCAGDPYRGPKKSCKCRKKP